MPVTFPAIRVGAPLRHGALSVFPLFAEPGGQVDYVLSDEAIDRGSVLVEEVSESGSVPDLSVENKGDIRVLFLEGEELVGAKQNRILNTSLLVAAHSKSRIPVSCVEQGRWGYRSRQFGSGGTHSPSKLRHYLRASVSDSLKAKRGHRSDQVRLWREVARQQVALEAPSDTGAMSDTFGAYGERLAEFRTKVPYVDGASGVAVAVGGKVVAWDVFDKPSTCRKVWDRLLSGCLLDALEAQDQEAHAEVGDVERVVAGMNDRPWELVETVGEGEECRAESEAAEHASALSLGGVLVHGSLVAEW